jgi:hypothetical protein
MSTWLPTRTSSTDSAWLSAKDKRYSAVLSKQAALVGSVINKGLHAYGDKWVAIVIVIALHMCVG